MLLLPTALWAAGLAAAAASSKRGLVFVPNSKWPQDNQVWVKKGSDLTWYYNYQAQPSPAFASISQSRFEFVPMMWGVSNENPDDTTFFSQIKSLISSGTNVSRVLGFNEPNGDYATGGSYVSPSNAARAWVANFIPLQEQFGLKVGLPAITGADTGLPWLAQFLGNCSNLISSGNAVKNCTYDFLPLHWYDNIYGLQTHIRAARDAFPETPIWMTEYAYPYQEISTTEQFYNDSVDFFENQVDYVERYSYYGGFRSSVSNVGPNVPFLNNGGMLTNIGSWFLGGNATGISPTSTTTASAAGVVRVPSFVVASAAALLGAVVASML